MPAWVSFSCADGSHLNDGTPFDEAVDLVADHPAVVAVGVNCTSPVAVPSLVELAAARTGKPLVAYPNRGGTWDPARKRWTGDDAPGGFGPLALELRAAGARLIGDVAAQVLRTSERSPPRFALRPRTSAPSPPHLAEGATPNEASHNPGVAAADNSTWDRQI